jgi:hypothetical protein
MDTSQNNPFLSSAIIVGAIFAIIMYGVTLVFSYRMIGSEPSGSLMSPMMYMSFLSCLVGLFAGLFAVRHHVKEYNAPLKPGRGAVIGLTTGVLISLFSTIFGLIWLLIDPNFTDNLTAAMIAQMESIPGMPDGALQDTIDGIYTESQRAQTVMGQLRTFAISGAIMGALNAITGIIGVKVFAPVDENLDLD